MATGTVKWFNNAKGYGFVLAQGSNDDLFIHYSSIQMDGYKSLKAGQEIQYDVQEGPKGLHAVNIRYAPGTEPVAADSADDAHKGAQSSQHEDDLTRNPMHNVPLPAAAAAKLPTAREVEVEEG